jgi:hypothetical protein
VDGRCTPFSCLECLPSNTSIKKCIYLEAHASNILSSVLSAKIKEEIKMKYGLVEKANVWLKRWQEIILNKYSRQCLIIINTHWSRSRRAISVQKENVKFVSLGKPNCPISQTGISSFGRTETSLVEEDCSISSFNDDDDDDDTNNEYDYE